MTSIPATTSSTKLNPLALAGFIVSLVGLVLFFFGWLGALIALVGIVLSFIGRSQIKRRGERGSGLAVAGIIIGIVGLILGVLYTVVLVSVLLPQLQQMQ